MPVRTRKSPESDASHIPPLWIAEGGLGGPRVSPASSAGDDGDAWFRNCPDALSLTRFPSGKMMEVNASYCALLGYRREELINRTPEEVGLLVHPEGFRKMVKRLRGSSSLQNYETDVRARDGHILQVQASMQLLTRGARPVLLTILRDMTSIRKTESALRTVSGALEAAAEGIAFVDVQGRYTSANPAYTEMVGCTREEIIGTFWIDTVHPDDLNEMHVAYSQMIESGKSTIEVRGVRRDRSLFDKQVTLVRLQEADGSFAGHCRCATDITARKARERAVAESEAKLRAIWNSAPEAVLVIDQECAISDVNPTGLKMLDFESLEQMQGHSITEFIDSMSQDRILAAIHGALAGEPTSLEFEMSAAGGFRRWVDSKIVPLGDDDGSVRRALMISRDISKRKSTESALRRSEVRYRDLLENANDIVGMVDAAGCFTSLNRAAEKLLGYTRAELLNKPLFDIVAPESMDLARRLFEAHQSGACLTAVETVLMATKDGKVLSLDVSTRSVFEELQFVGGRRSRVTSRSESEIGCRWQLRKKQRRWAGWRPGSLTISTMC
jgi:PAS domain S-box-containing protein